MNSDNRKTACPDAEIPTVKLLANALVAASDIKATNDLLNKLNLKLHPHALAAARTFRLDFVEFNWEINEEEVIAVPIFTSLKHPGGIPLHKLPLQDVHEARRENSGNAAQHPLIPLIKAYLNKRVPVVIDRRSTGIMPSFAASLIRAPHVIIRADPNFLSNESLAWIPHDPAEIPMFPGLPADTQPVAAFMLAILDSEINDKQVGAGAPLRDRFFAECLMLAATQDRKTGERFFLGTPDCEPLTIADAVEWAGWNPKDYRKNAENRGKALVRALDAMYNIKMPLNDPGGFLKTVILEGVEGRRLTDRIAVSVRLLLGSEVGAAVNRQILRRAGKASAIAWRMYLSLCFEWNNISHKGKVPHLTMPSLKKDEGGNLVDAFGKIITGKGGIPQRLGRPPRAVETGGREPHPLGEKLHKTYDRPEDLISLAFPLGSIGSRWNPRRTVKACIYAVRWLAAEKDASGNPLTLNKIKLDFPAVKIQRLNKPTKGNPDGFPWRILPPEIRTD